MTLEVLAERLDGMRELITEKFNNNEREHSTILSQTNTAGKIIDSLFKRIEGLEKWKSWVMGGFAIVGIIIVPLIVVIIRKVFF